jgi:hypothetical protein
MDLSTIKDKVWKRHVLGHIQRNTKGGRGMKVGDLVYDYRYGDVGTILQILPEVVEIYWRDWNSRTSDDLNFLSTETTNVFRNMPLGESRKRFKIISR